MTKTHSKEPIQRSFLITNLIIIAATAFILSACQNLAPTNRQDLVTLPKSWEEKPSRGDIDRKNIEATHTITENQNPPKTNNALRWSSLINHNKFLNLARLALNNNPTLKQRKLAIDIAKAELRSSGMTLYIPDLSLGLNAERTGTEDNQDPASNPQITESGNTNEKLYSLSANLSYELNIWGQLSDTKRASAYSYAAQLAEYKQAQQDLIFSLSSAWFDLLSAHELINLFENRLSNQQQNLKAIESRYHSGINSALDVYLARNNVAQEESNLANERATLQTAKRAIQILIQHYPDANSLTDDNLPSMDSLVSNTEEPDFFLLDLLPSSLLTRKPSLQSAWLNVLIQNAEVAIAHKARFPSLTLNASARKNSDSFSALTDSGILTWSIGASLLQPLLSGGRLKTAEKVARLQLEQAELEYITTVYNAFNTIENTLTQQSALRDQLHFTQAAATNAVYAEELAFQQYQKGLVTFTTVLESQRRSFDAQAQVINLKTQIAKNFALLLSEFVADIDLNKNKSTNSKNLDTNSSDQAE